MQTPIALLAEVLEAFEADDNSPGKNHPWIPGASAGPLKAKLETALSMATRPFESDEYCAFGGATGWSRDHAFDSIESRPLVRYLEHCAVVAGCEQVECLFSTDSTPESYALHVAFPTQAAAAVFVDALPVLIDRDEAIKLGFEPI